MGTRQTLTLETARKAWVLHEKGIDTQLIAFTVGVSESSVKRIINVFGATKRGEDLDALFGVGALQNIRQYARDILGVPTEVKPAPVAIPPVQKEADEHNTAAFMVKVLEELEKTNALLERLCEAWGCKE